MAKAIQTTEQNKPEPAEPVKMLPGDLYRDLRISNPPPPVDGPVDKHRDPGKSRGALPPDVAALVGVPRQVVRAVTKPAE